MMRYYVDTEFNWDYESGTIDPISVAAVAEDGREFYLALAGCVTDPEWYEDDDFAVTVVLPALGDVERVDWSVMSDRLKEFIGDDTPEFWGDYAAFDYVVLSMLMGGFEDWPEKWPMVILDLQQEDGGSDAASAEPSLIPHNALADARAVKRAWERLAAGEIQST